MPLLLVLLLSRSEFRPTDLRAAAGVMGGADRVGACCCVGLLDRDKVYDFEVRIAEGLANA